VALNDPRNRVGVLNRDGTVTVDMSRYRPWLTGFETLELDVLACPLQQFRKTNRTMEPFPILVGALTSV